MIMRFKTSINIFKKSSLKKCELNLSNIEIFHVLVNKLTSHHLDGGKN